jgi:hypothetical protein
MMARRDGQGWGSAEVEGFGCSDGALVADVGFVVGEVHLADVLVPDDEVGGSG